MKKILSLLVVTFISVMLVFNVTAAGGMAVYSENVVTTLNESFTVPLKLKNNTGLMGFKVTIKYPDGQIQLKDISSGSLTKNGLFNTTVTDYYSVKGSFDIVWSDTANITGDGTLAMLTFETVGYADYGDYKIEISYSQDDTFNEKWESVKLDCQSVNVKITDAKTASKKNEKTKAVSQSSGEAVSDDYLISSVKAMLESYQVLDISDVTEDYQKESMVKFVNSRNQSYSQKAVQYKSFDELKAAYNKALTNEAVTNVLESADGDKIIELSDTILKKYGVMSFSELSDEDKEKAVDEALGSIAQQGGDTQSFAGMGDSDIAAGALDGIVGGAKEEQKNALDVEKKPVEAKPAVVIGIITAVVAVAVIVTGVLIYIKKKAKKNEEDKKDEK